MAKIKTPAISAKTYRHFAVITLACTLLLAIFSSGENRQAIANQVSAQQAAAKARRDATRAKYGTPKLVRAPQPAQTFGNSDDLADSGAPYGAPMDPTGSTVQDVGSLGDPAKDCEKGFLVQEAKSDEDPDGPPLTKCLRRKNDNSPSANSITPAERKRQIDTLVAETLGKAPASRTGK